MVVPLCPAPTDHPDWLHRGYEGEEGGEGQMRGGGCKAVKRGLKEGGDRELEGGSCTITISFPPAGTSLMLPRYPEVDVQGGRTTV